MKSLDASNVTEFVILDSGSVIQIKRESTSHTPATKDVRLRLTHRDYEILRFLLDQKFASLEALYYRFFDHRVSVHAPPPKEYYVARQRLGLLKRAGLILSERVYSESKGVYLISQFGLKALEGKLPDSVYATPARDVDFRNYEHDKRVNLVRVVLERQKRVVQWWSERRLRMEGFRAPGISKELPESLVPDGLFVNPRGERIAVEIEASNRKQSRFQEKVNAYRSVMDPYDPKSALIHKVLFVACTPSIQKKLGKVVSGRKNEFALEGYPYFLAKLYLPENGSVLKSASSKDFLSTQPDLSSQDSQDEKDESDG